MDSLNRIYRKFFCRGGHGVHSPFVFDLITTVIEERRHYYCYERLWTVRLQLLQRQGTVTYCRRQFTMEKLLSEYGFTESEHRLLFRLANRFRPQKMYVVGSDAGLTPLYLTAYSKNTTCTVYEPEPTVAALAQEFVEKYASAPVRFTADGLDINSDNGLDFIVLSSSYTDSPDSGEPFSMQTFEHFLPYVHAESVMVISGINRSSKNRNTWKAICSHPKVTVTLDLYRLGIVFFNPKLHRKTYPCIVM